MFQGMGPGCHWARGPLAGTVLAGVGRCGRLTQRRAERAQMGAGAGGRWPGAIGEELGAVRAWPHEAKARRSAAMGAGAVDEREQGKEEEGGGGAVWWPWRCSVTQTARRDGRR